MYELWFDHLSSALKDNNVIAYMWDASEDRFEWAGDLYAFLGLQSEDHPKNNNQFHKMLNPQDVPERLSALYNLLNGHAIDGSYSFSSSYRLRRTNGSYIEVEETASVQKGGTVDGRKVCGFIKIKHAATSEADSDNVVAGNLDSGFANYGRRMLQQKVEEWFDTKNQDSGDIYGYVLAIGIDRMALFNDVIGPRYADELIEKTGERLRRIVGEAGVATRIDGDVYGVLFRRAPHNEMAAVAKYILNNFCNLPLQTSMGPIGVGISIGGVTLGQAKNADSVIAMAEMAMNVAKDKGRSCFVSYDEASLKAEGNRSLLKSADTFLKAMKSNKLRLAFQPIIGSHDKNVSFHESLIRLIDDSGKLIPAGMFMPAIEELGLARLVDQFALRMAINELEMFPDLNLSVNVSNLSLNNHDWLRNLVAALRDRPSVAKRLIVEITESAVIHEPENTRRIISTMRDLGCRVALDDFGAGYTAFSQLKNLNVDIVKIDKSFVRNIDDDYNHLFVQTLKELAHGVNVQTVGEGAETMAEADLLTEDGIDYIQGYVFGFPRTERVWLPKDHVHRQIVPASIHQSSADDLHEETMEDIDVWRKRNAG